MIYMRDRHHKKQKDTQDDPSARHYLDQLKSKFAKKTPKQVETRKENDIKTLPINQKPQKYSIGKSKGSQAEEKFSESIIVHDLPDNPNPIFGKRHSLAPVKCFDIQILNDLGSSRFRAQAYIQLLEREKELKNQEIKALKTSLYKEKEKSSTRNEIQEMKLFLSQQTQLTVKCMKFFTQGKNLLLNVAMQLIDTKNDLFHKMTERQLKQKALSLSRTIQLVERTVSIYTNLINLNPRKAPSEVANVDELWNTVKYQQKIIQVMRQSEANATVKNYLHQNTLLRYEINRISDHNEQLLKLLAQQEDSLHLEYSRTEQAAHIHTQKTNKRPQETVILHEQESNQIEEEESSIEQSRHTPFHKLKEHFSPSIEHPFSNLQVETLTETKNKLQRQLSECKQRVQVLLKEKEYVVDQLQQAQNGQKQLKQTLRALMQQNSQLREQVRELKVKHAVKQDSYELAKESEKVLEEQNDLLRDKIKFIFKPNGKDTVTVEELLKLLKRKELAHYHQALMELISKYETRISELTNNQLEERTLRQHSMTFCRGLFNMVQATSSTHDAPTLHQIIDYVKTYEDIMAELKENQIDVYLRKIRSFSIGIDESAAQTIKEELKDYVYQLQTRLPTLSEEYLQDGSSIADSYHNSVQRFD